MKNHLRAPAPFINAMRDAWQAIQKRNPMITGAQVANDLKVDGSTFSRYLSGKSLMPRAKLELFCQIMDLTGEQHDRILSLHPDNPMRPSAQIAEDLNAALNSEHHRELANLLEFVVGNLIATNYKLSEARDRHFARDWATTLELCKAARGSLETGHALHQAYLWDAEGTIYVHQNKVDLANEAYETAAEFADKTDDFHIRGMTKMHRGDFNRHRGRWEEALNYYDASHEEFMRADSLVNLARVQRKQAQVHLSRGEWPDARNLLHDAEKYLEHEYSSDAKYERIKLNIALGWLYSLRGRQDDALKKREAAAMQADSYRTRAGTSDKYLQAQAHTQAGYEYLLANNLQQAHAHLFEKFEQHKLPETKEDALLYVGRARYWIEQARRTLKAPVSMAEFARLLEQAQKNLDQAEELGHLAQVPLHLASITRRKANLFELKEDYGAALTHYRRALREFRRLDAHYYIAYTCLDLCRVIRRRAGVDTAEGWYEDADRHDIMRLMSEAHREAADDAHPFADVMARLYRLRGEFVIDCLIDLNDAQVADSVDHSFTLALRHAGRYNQALCSQIAEEIILGRVRMRDLGLKISGDSAFIKRVRDTQIPYPVGSASAAGIYFLDRELSDAQVEEIFRKVHARL